MLATCFPPVSLSHTTRACRLVFGRLKSSLRRTFVPLLILCFTSGSAICEPYPFTVDIQQTAENHQILAKNAGPAPVSVRLALSSSENIRSNTPWPIFAVIRPYSQQQLAIVEPANRQRSSRFATRVSFQPGNYLASHAAGTRYRLPFADNQTFVISQASNGPLSTHDSAENRHAIDITMPTGTPVVAARSGTVIEVAADYQRGSKDRTLVNAANHIRILHEDDTIATYAHLAENGVLVNIGEAVEAGQHIGLSGSTGYSSGPHLHFAVQRLQRKGDGFDNVAIPFRFYVGNPAYEFEPQYLQSVTADYVSPGKAPPLVPSKRVMPTR
jgi:murein DD-endopeptidase MepM/ murein hydrolase activator NlpD